MKGGTIRRQLLWKLTRPWKSLRDSHRLLEAATRLPQFPQRLLQLVEKLKLKTVHQTGASPLIPSPQEKREAVLRDHALDLLANLDTRLGRIEAHLGLSADEARAFRDLMACIRRDESEARRIHAEQLAADVGER